VILYDVLEAETETVNGEIVGKSFNAVRRASAVGRPV